MTTTSRAPANPAPQAPISAARRLLGGLYQRKRLQLALLLAAPTGWFVVLYLGSLAVLLVTAFWYLDPTTSSIVHSFTLQNFVTLATEPVYRTIALRTVTIAALVTITDAVIAFPIAYYLARVASARPR